MKKLRLALVRQKYRPDGGAERFVSQALAALDMAELELHIITRQWQDGLKPDWQVHICDPRQWGRTGRYKGFASAARQLWQAQHFDLVQSHEPIAGCDLYRAGDGVHQRWLAQYARILPGWRRRMLFASCYHRHVMQAERELYASPCLQAVICNAQMIKREIIDDFALDEQKIHVIHNAVNTSYFVPADEQRVCQLRAHWHIPRQASCLIFAGSGFRRKGLAAAIQALAPTDKHLLVVGKDKALARYQALAKTLHCEKRIHFMGMQPQPLEFYQMADGLLLPTLYDPFPNVILEALACGLPVITSHNCGGKEFIRDGQNGYVCDALDIDSLRHAAMALPPRVTGSRQSQHARASIQHCTLDNLCGALLMLYRQLVGDSTGFEGCLSRHLAHHSEL